LAVDPVYPHSFRQRKRGALFVLNKTGWAYFGCKDPRGFLERAKAQGVNVIRVALEGTPYFSDLGIEMWPWGGSRDQPDWTRFDEEYWNRVEERIRLAGELGIGFDLVLHFTTKPAASEIERFRPYWKFTLDHLAKYANILTWRSATSTFATKPTRTRRAPI